MSPPPPTAASIRPAKNAKHASEVNKPISYKPDDVFGDKKGNHKSVRYLAHSRK